MLRGTGRGGALGAAGPRLRWAAVGGPPLAVSSPGPRGEITLTGSRLPYGFPVPLSALAHLSEYPASGEDRHSQVVEHARMSTAELLHRPLPRRRGTDRPAHPAAPAPAAPAELADQRWGRPALVVLLALTAFAYIWDLSASGYANSFYAAAVQAGTKSWKALLFGSIDSSSFITVDKPPASLWVMAMSGRIFGFSSWSMLVPQALEGVAAVALLHATVRRWFGTGAGLLAGAVFALTPVAALMFRFNNPDALLVLTLVAAAYCVVRALERGGTRWVLAAGAMIGFGFLAKMGQALIVLPPFAAVYLLAAPVSLRRRLGQLLVAGGAIVLSAGWWVAIVALWPAASRPYIDGSPSNSIINLITGYNGLGRLTGSGGAAAGGGANFSGATGPLRMFNSLMGGQASWLLPAALIAMATGLWAGRRAARTDRTRSALLLWGGWLLVTAAVFSFSKGVIHTYYAVALAPAIAALVAIGAVLAWRRRERLLVRALAAAAVAATAVWAHVLLGRTPSFETWLRAVVLPVGLLGAAALVFSPWLGRRATVAAVLIAGLASLAGPTAYTIETATTSHTGSIVSAGPATAGGGFGGGFGGGLGGSFGGPGGGPGGSFGGAPPSAAPRGAAAAGSSPSGAQPLFGSGTGGGAPSGVPGGEGMATSAALTKALQSAAGGYRWVAATSGSQSAASLELASGEPVMAIGGFSGEGGNLTLAQFEAYVKKGEIHYYVAGGGIGGGPGRGGSASQLAAWVEKHFRSVTIGGQTVYDLTAKAA